MPTPLEGRYARYNLVEQVALGNVHAVKALGLPPPGPELDSLWQYVPPGRDDLYDLLLAAGCTPNPPPNTPHLRLGDYEAIRSDYPGEDGIEEWAHIVYMILYTDRVAQPGSWLMTELQNLPVQALQILYDLDGITDEQRLQIREIGGGNYHSHPFTSARWSTNLEDDDSASEVDTISDSDDDDVYVPRELREENEGRPMPAVYSDRVNLPPPTYEKVLEWDATHGPYPTNKAISAVRRGDVDALRPILPSGRALNRLLHYARTVEMIINLVKAGADPTAEIDGKTPLRSYIDSLRKLERRVHGRMRNSDPDDDIPGFLPEITSPNSEVYFAYKTDGSFEGETIALDLLSPYITEEEMKLKKVDFDEDGDTLRTLKYFLLDEVDTFGDDFTQVVGTFVKHGAHPTASDLGAVNNINLPETAFVMLLSLLLVGHVTESEVSDIYAPLGSALDRAIANVFPGDLYKVLYDYKGADEKELNLRAGEHIHVYRKMDEDGWYRGIGDQGRRGLVPSNYVRRV